MVSQLMLCRSWLRVNPISNSINFSSEAQKMFTVIHLYMHPHALTYVARQPKFWPHLCKLLRSMSLSITQTNASDFLVVVLFFFIYPSQNNQLSIQLKSSSAIGTTWAPEKPCWHGKGGNIHRENFNCPFYLRTRDQRRMLRNHMWKKLIQ